MENVDGKFLPLSGLPVMANTTAIAICRLEG